ncbi:uncharacterized protein [Engystomops pustulosus]|uniref:uncharacterized protein isoform X2 n=1 Tax=Engystomops pustulosus TaxID=76066 RepID=UPI003AFA4B1B
MNRTRKRSKRGAGFNIKPFQGWHRYKCEECNIACTSSAQLEQHLKGNKHIKRLSESKEGSDRQFLTTFPAEENTFPLENMVVLDQTGEDLPNYNPASPASCDSSDSATAASPSDFQTIDHFPKSRMVILDEKNEDNHYPASPASCEEASEATPSNPDFQTIDNVPKGRIVILDEKNEDNDYPASPASCEEASEATPSNPGHIVILDEKNEDNDYPASPASCEGASEATPSNPDKPSRKRRRIKMSKDDHTAPKSPVSVVSSCSSSNFAPVADGDHGKSKKLKGEKHHSKRSTKSNREAIPAFQIEPVNSNQDVFKFLKTFAIGNESDLAFARKVTEMFSNALRKFKETKLEEIFCTEAESDSPEELEGSANGPCNNEPTIFSIPQATNPSACERITSEPGSPMNLSPPQSVSNPISSADCQPDSPIINQSEMPDTSRSPTNICEDLDTSNKACAINNTYDYPCLPTEANLLLESECCVTAEASCSDDEDV